MASPRRPLRPADEPSLDEQIALAERAVIERDQRVRGRADALVRHAKREAVKLAGGGLLLGLGTAALAWWLNRPGRKPAPAPEEAPREQAQASSEPLLRDAGVLLAGLLPVLWPLLPRTWRRGLKPETAGTLLSLLAPLLGKLFRRKAS